MMVYMMWNQPPFAIVTKDTSGDQDDQGLRRPHAGRRAGHADDAALLPVFIQEERPRRPTRSRSSNMAPNLQEPMLIKGDIDAALVFNVTSYFNLVPEPSGSGQGLQAGSSSATTASTCIPTA